MEDTAIEGETVTMQVKMNIPKQYADFWEKVRNFYSLDKDALDEVVSEQFIKLLNVVHDDLRACKGTVEGIDPEDIRKSLEV